MEKYMHKCETCGTMFASMKIHAKFCSKACSLKATHLKECAWCKGLFTPRAGKLYCSDACRSAARRQREKESSTVMVTCKTCGKSFRLGVRRKFCSAECAGGIVYQYAKNEGVVPEPEESRPKHKVTLEEAAKNAKDAKATYGAMYAPKVEIIFPWKVGKV